MSLIDSVSRHGLGRLWLGLLIATANGCLGLTGIDRLSFRDCFTDAQCTETGTHCVSGQCVASPSGGAGQGGTGQGGTGQGGAGGEAGALPECSSHHDCIDQHSGEPFLCKNQRCVGLLSDPDCTQVLGLGDQMQNLIDRDPIVLGAYAGIAGEDSGLAIDNYELAVDEFNEASLGGLEGPGLLRPVLMVLCHGGPHATATSLEHLIGTLGVPGILALLSPEDLNRLFLQAGGRALFINPVEATSAWADPDHLLWHLRGSPEDYAPPVAALLRRAEVYLKAQRAGTADADRPLRVTLVQSDFSSLTRTVAALEKYLNFNGMSATDNREAGYFRAIESNSSLTHAVGDAFEALDELELHPPDVILAMATSEFAEQIPQLELDWPSKAPNRPRPFYIMSPWLFGNWFFWDFDFFSARDRTVGINAAHAADRRLYDDYVSRLLKSYPELAAGSGTQGENYYDAAYYLLYAVAAAGGDLSGGGLANGLLRIIDLQAPAVEIGPAAIWRQIHDLQNPDYRMQLVGTMGPPNFDSLTGTRKVPLSAWCVTHQLELQADALRYDDATGQFEGRFPCFAGF